MAEYIKREALRETFEKWRDAHADVDDEKGCGLLEDVIWEVDAQPAADVAPVKYGRFLHTHIDEYYGEWGECSVCGWENPGNGQYCNGCGAKMDGEEHGGT